MLKKTTVYLSDNEILILKKKATLQNKTVAEVIRLSIRQACQPQNKEEKKIWDALDKIWAQTNDIPSEKIESAVNQSVNEVRNVKKARRRA